MEKESFRELETVAIHFRAKTKVRQEQKEGIAVPALSAKDLWDKEPTCTEPPCLSVARFAPR